MLATQGSALQAAAPPWSLPRAPEEAHGAGAHSFLRASPFLNWDELVEGFACPDGWWNCCLQQC